MINPQLMDQEVLARLQEKSMTIWKSKWRWRKVMFDRRWTLDKVENVMDEIIKLINKVNIKEEDSGRLRRQNSNAEGGKEVRPTKTEDGPSTAGSDSGDS